MGGRPEQGMSWQRVAPHLHVKALLGQDWHSDRPPLGAKVLGGQGWQSVEGEPP